MTYQQSHSLLRRLLDQSVDEVAVPGSRTGIFNFTFESASWPILPGAAAYRCDRHGVEFAAGNSSRATSDTAQRLDMADVDVMENRRFRYSVFADRDGLPARGVIVLFHGLNERDWAKYLPWAHRLVQGTGKAVVLFPIAFHMNRAPAAWGDPRLMKDVARRRQNHSPTIANATFANAAISNRLEAIPERFCWSGLQTFYDLVQLVDEMRGGGHPLVAADASIDFFGYSIGAFLAEILMMTDPGGRFSKTRLFMFCGGVTVDRMAPNSRYILDSDATIALYSFFLARFESEIRANDRLAHFMSDQHEEGRYFRAMLNNQDKKEMREERFREFSERIAALALRADQVIPANEVLNTLKGDFRDIPIDVEIADFPYSYSHVVPFPLDAPEADVDASFEFVFDRACRWLA